MAWPRGWVGLKSSSSTSCLQAQRNCLKPQVDRKKHQVKNVISTFIITYYLLSLPILPSEKNSLRLFPRKLNGK
jgi:hypothetical protein